MTSSDGDGFAGSGPQPDGPAEHGPRDAGDRGFTRPDDDPVRLTPPADPWLTEASTSVLGGAASVRGPGVVPPADTAPFAGAAFPGAETPLGGPVSGWAGGAPQRRRGRRATRWVVAVLAACALFIAGMLAVDQFGSADDGDALGPTPTTGTGAEPVRTGTRQERTPATDPPAGAAPTGGQPGSSTGGQPGSSAGAAAPATSANAGTAQVIYEVTASGSRNVGSVSYTDQDGEIIRLGGIPLPWRLAFPTGERRQPRVLIAQRKRGGDAGPVTCTVTVNGKLLSSTTAHGRYAAPQCSGFG